VNEERTGSGYDKWNISVVTCDTYIHNGQPSHGGDRKIFEVMTSTLPKETLGSVVSLLAATPYQGNPDRNHKLWNIVSSERYTLHMQVLLECCYIYMESSQWEN
jgi:hypothetical protein